MRQWRLLYDSATTGMRNMAADEAILRAVGAGEEPPTLRFYDWHPACLSLGYGQKAADVDMSRLAERGWDLVRRPTGGRAILHIDELTYSVALPADHPIAAGDVVASYRRISLALIAGLQRLGVFPYSERQTAPASRSLGPVCFEVPSHYEITADGRKLVGSAQVRRYGGVLQHGTLPLSGDVARICEVLVYEDEECRAQAQAQVYQRATTLAEVAGRQVIWREAAEALASGFAAVFDLDFYETELSNQERELAAILAADLYGKQEWTRRR